MAISIVTAAITTVITVTSTTNNIIPMIDSRIVGISEAESPKSVALTEAASLARSFLTFYFTPVSVPRPEQPLGRGSALARLGAELELRRSGSSLGPSQ